MIIFFKQLILTLKNILEFKKLNEDWKKNVFFSENSSYSAHFDDLLEKFYLNKKKVCFLTSDLNDLIFKYKSETIKVFYISPIFGQIIFLNYIKCKRLIMTMPDLENFHIKKSKFCEKYFYLFHSPFSTNMIYKNKAFFAYDEICCVGNHHIEEITEYVKKFKLNKKILLKGGYFRIDKLSQFSKNKKNNKILIAPSWAEKNIITECCSELIKILVQGDYEVILRPHIESLKRNKNKINQIENIFKDQKNFRIEKGNFALDSLSECNYLITDWSGISMEFAFAFEKPILFVNTPKKILNKNFNDISLKPIEEDIRDKIGIIVDPENISLIIEAINNLEDKKDYFKNEIIQQRNKYLFNYKKSVQYVYDYLIRE
tara:strand:+ start:1078 stop:2196 length:1119 start_codon:yes stop_codon:yes gene_type:complete